MKNEYYVISEAESRKLLNTPEIVGYEVYNCLVSSTFSDALLSEGTEEGYDSKYSFYPERGAELSS